jgi:hypothetical protein
MTAPMGCATNLLVEIVELQAELERVSGSLATDNLVKAQTFKEMIHSRNALLTDLLRRNDARAGYA